MEAKQTANRIARKLLPLAGFALWGCAAAASPTVLSVTGLLKPDPCSLALGDNGSVDFDTVPADDLKEGTTTELRRKEVRLVIACSSPALVSLKVVDNRADSAAETLPDVRLPRDEGFGLGMVRGRPIGNYYLVMDHDWTQLNGVRGDILYRRTSSMLWKQTLPRFRLSTLDTYSWGRQNTRSPMQVRTLHATISVVPYLLPRERLPAGDLISLDGSATFELGYL